MSGRRLALRIAARTSIRSLGRSALIITMVTLPVTGMVAIATVAASSYLPTAQELVTTQLGDTEARLTVIAPPTPTLKQNPQRPDEYTGCCDGGGELTPPSAVLPAGTRILALTTTTITATTATGVATFPVLEGPSWDASFTGMFDVAEGRAPRTDDEVMVTAALLPRLGAKLGDTVELSEATVPSVTIVGILDDRTQSSATERFYAPSGALSGASPLDNLRTTTFYLPDTEVTWGAIQKLNQEGITVLSRSVLLNPPPSDGRFPNSGQWANLLSILPIILIIVGFAAFEIVLLAGAAFTVTARQQQRTLATIASTGAPRSLLFRILTTHGLVLGAIAGLLGVLFGIASAGGFMLLTTDGSSTQYYGFHLPWPALLAAVAFAVLIGWIASLVPARITSRFDVVAALRGARKPPSPARRRSSLGVTALILGVTITLLGGVLMAVLMNTPLGRLGAHPLIAIAVAMVIAGPVLAQIGLMLCGPLLLRMGARIMRRWSIGARLAARDAARNPSRAVPALAAIMTAVFVSVFAMSLLTSTEESTRLSYQYDQPPGTVTAGISIIDRSNPDSPSVSEYAHPAAVQQAIRNSVAVNRMATLAAVRDPVPAAKPDTPAEEAESPTLGLPVLAVPAPNRCPAWPNSPAFDPEAQDPDSPSGMAILSDWRCQGYYVGGINFPQGHIYVSDLEGLALALGDEPSEAARSTFTSGGAVAFYRQYVLDGKLSISWWPPDRAMDAANQKDTGQPQRTETLDAVVELPEHPLPFGVFISAATADRLGLEYHDTTVIASTVTMPTTAQADALTQAMRNLPDNGEGEVDASIEYGPASFAGPGAWGLLALAALIAIAAAAVAIGLARFDGRRDDATLSALGAGRLVRRSFAFWQAVIIAGSGAVLGALMGIVPALALSALPDVPFVPPWLQIGIAVVALPLVIACGSWLLATRSTVSARRVAIA